MFKRLSFYLVQFKIQATILQQFTIITVIFVYQLCTKYWNSAKVQNYIINKCWIYLVPHNVIVIEIETV